MITETIFRAVMLGGAVADAVGVPAEFKSRRYLRESPVTDMSGYGTHKKPRGTFSDDTSMSLATLDALSECGVDYNAIMERFGAWWYKGEYTADGDTFDIGNTTSVAIDNYFFYKMPAVECGVNDESANGNGALMRIHPVALYCMKKGLSDEESIAIIKSVARLTHAHERSQIACVIFYFILREIIASPEKASIQRGVDKSFEFIKESPEMISYLRVLTGEVLSAAECEIKSSGYVVDTLEAALWALNTADDYKSTVLLAVNLGEDTDTVAAVAGVLAGVLYGEGGIPRDWLDALIKREYIEELCKRPFM